METTATDREFLRIVKECSKFDNSKEIELYVVGGYVRDSIMGLSSKDIAFTLSKISGREISKSTVDSLFRDQLFLKFEVYNRDALFEKLLRLGFDRYVPSDLLPKVELPVSELIAY